jgi:two-component system cell cycle response regulator DivK
MTKILLVEDDDMSRDMLSRRLERKGYTVVTAVNGAEGLQLANRDLPELILLDMSLPVMDGWTTARYLKDSETTRAIPVIGLTAHAMAGDRERVLEAGCNDYDSKPVDFARLLGKIQALLGSKG